MARTLSVIPLPKAVPLRSISCDAGASVDESSTDSRWSIIGRICSQYICPRRPRSADAALSEPANSISTGRCMASCPLASITSTASANGNAPSRSMLANVITLRPRPLSLSRSIPSVAS